MAFWSNHDINPKLKSRFTVRIGEGDVLINVKSVDKPTFTIDTKTYTLINHKFKYPGIPVWEPITITFVDPVVDGDGQSTEATLYNMITDTGYIEPTKTTHMVGKESTYITTPSKASTAANSFYSAFAQSNSGGFGGTIKISQLNQGGSPRDIWTLHGPIIKSVSFGDLAYADDELVEYKLVVDYDYATYKKL